MHRLPARRRWRSAVPGVPFVRTAVLPRRRPGRERAVQRRGALLDAADAAELQVLDHVGRDEIDPCFVVVARHPPLRPELARLEEHHLHGELQVFAGDRVVVVGKACLGMRHLEEAVLDVLFEAERNGDRPGVPEISRRAGI